ncbi:glycosyltransferase family 4 protein [Rhodoplanes roseus]|uniref:Glycosyl transferase family 1 n=1 Tax=Rhodoplanes roseus TaxID=29409 RepID=A0A327KRQ7_9BRAD|nr:glycosyltransferase family 4 protein [Rhodoplanes roseus]RAI40363.1 glycosyl transferase family 1 [Rhodoplanes roseus]
MTLQIVQIVQELSSVGGVESVALELSGVFGRAGVANSVIASNVGTMVDRRTMIERVAPWLARIPTRGALRHIGRALVVPLFTFAATWAARRHRDAVVISHGDSLLGDVLVVHAVNAESLAEKRRSGSWRWLLNPTHLWVAARERWMIGGLRYRVFVAVSSRVADELQRHYGVPPSRIRVIPNGIDLHRFRPDPQAGAAIRDEFGIPRDAKLLLFVGHEFDRKGLAHAVEALEHLDEDTWLLVVGSENPAPFRRQAKRSGDRLVFAGSRRDVQSFYSAADAFVFPTSYETFSLVCMEAMASELPVFATPVGGIEDYLHDGVNGFRIAADGADIAAKVRRVLGDPALRDRLRRGARDTAERYGWDRIGAEYISLAEELSRPVAGRT